MGTDAKSVVRLSISERVQLEALLAEPRVAKDRALRARMLWMADVDGRCGWPMWMADVDGPAWTDSRIAEAFEVVTMTVARLRQRCVWEGTHGGAGGTDTFRDQAAEARRCGRGDVDRVGVWQSSGRTGEVDVEIVGRQAGRVGDRVGDQ